MTEQVDKLSEKIAAARALPEAAGFEATAENLALREHLSLPQIAEMLRAKQSARAAVVAANMAKAQGKAGGRDGLPEIAPPKSQISSAAPVAAPAPAAAASPRPAGKITPQAPMPAASRQSVDDLWTEIVAGLNAEYQQGASKAAAASGVTPSKPDPWAEIVSDINAQNARSGSPT